MEPRHHRTLPPGREDHPGGSVRSEIAFCEEGYLVDGTVLDKQHARQIDPVRRQWNGNAHRGIRGIGVVTCVYVNSEAERFWTIDYRIYAPDEDGKTKLDHVSEMLINAVHQKRTSDGSSCPSGRC